MKVYDLIQILENASSDDCDVKIAALYTVFDITCIDRHEKNRTIFLRCASPSQYRDINPGYFSDDEKTIRENLFIKYKNDWKYAQILNRDIDLLVDRDYEEYKQKLKEGSNLTNLYLEW